MADNLRELIDAARIPRQRLTENDGISDTGIPGFRHSPFDSSLTGSSSRKPGSKTKDAKRELAVMPYQWAEAALRRTGSVEARTLMAVRDAARRQAERRQDPSSTPCYVGETIANGWNLTPRQLNEGLDKLTKAGYILTTNQKKGKHRQFTIVPKQT
jgi:hypothetical protein